jgi:hypothetical protein
MKESGVMSGMGSTLQLSNPTVVGSGWNLSQVINVAILYGSSG